MEEKPTAWRTGKEMGFSRAAGDLLWERLGEVGDGKGEDARGGDGSDCVIAL